MGFRFQLRIRIAPGVRLNLGKSGNGGGMGRSGLRLGVNAKRRWACRESFLAALDERPCPGHLLDSEISKALPRTFQRCRAGLAKLGFWNPRRKAVS